MVHCSMLQKLVLHPTPFVRHCAEVWGWALRDMSPVPAMQCAFPIVKNLMVCLGNVRTFSVCPEMEKILF